MTHLLLAGPVDRKQETLEQLGKLGAVHIVPISEVKTPADIQNKLDQTAKAIQILSKRETGHLKQDKTATISASAAILLSEEFERLKSDLFVLKSEYEELEPWGNFDTALINKLREGGFNVRLWICHPKDVKEFAADTVETVHANTSRSWVVTINRENTELQVPPVSAEFSLPARPLGELKRLIEAVNRQIAAKEAELDALAGQIPALRKDLARLQDEKKLAETGSGLLANEHFFVTEGWIPAEQEEAVWRNFPHLVIISREPIKGEDTPPVELKNNRFVKPFEQLVKAFTGLSYFSAMDTTWTVAVLFPIFAAFCLNDAGYGLALVGISIYLIKKTKVENFGQMGIAAGIASIILGLFTAQFFGCTAYKPLLDLGSDPDFAMKASLAVGIGVTLFALAVSVAKNGWRCNATGTILFIIGLGLAVSSFWWGKIAIAVGVLFWVLFPDSVFGNKIADAAWQCYGTIAALFGDTLSYLRLFALSISGSLLACVINESAKGMPLGVNIIFLAACHTFLLALSLISIYIHGNRLIFLEFGSRCIDPGNLFYQPFRIGGSKNNE